MTFRFTRFYTASVSLNDYLGATLEGAATIAAISSSVVLTIRQSSTNFWLRAKRFDVQIAELRFNRRTRKV
jgi:hypothetical protein